MSSSIICRVGIVGALAGGVAWVTIAPSSGSAPSRATQYAYNDSASGVAETSSVSPDEVARRREVERLLSPPVMPNAEAETEATDAPVTPKVKIRDPFYDFGPALAVQALADAEKTASKQPVAKPTPAAMKRTVAKPVYGKSTISAAWRKLDTIKRSAMFAKDKDRTTTSRFSTGRQTFRSSRWAGVFSDLPQ